MSGLDSDDGKIFAAIATAAGVALFFAVRSKRRWLYLVTAVAGIACTAVAVIDFIA